MSRHSSWGKRCVLGTDTAKPNEITFLPNLSDHHSNQWIGFCKGDQSHPEHLIIIKYGKKHSILYKKSSAFARPDSDFSKRLFDRLKILRCPDGKCFMSLQKKQTEITNLETVDIFRCIGHLRQKGHHSHMVRLEHGVLDVLVNSKPFGILVVYIEEKKQ